MSRKSKSPGAAPTEPVKHLFTHLSEFAIRDADNRVSYINVIHNVVLDEIPGALVALFIAVAFTGGGGKTFTVAVEAPDKKEIFRYPDQPVPTRENDASKNKMRLVNHTMCVLKPAVFMSEGTYHVVFKVDGKVFNREPFNVVLVPKKEEDGQC